MLCRGRRGGGGRPRRSSSSRRDSPAPGVELKGNAYPVGGPHSDCSDLWTLTTAERMMEEETQQASLSAERESAGVQSGCTVQGHRIGICVRRGTEVCDKDALSAILLGRPCLIVWLYDHPLRPRTFRGGKQVVRASVR